MTCRCCVEKKCRSSDWKGGEGDGGGGGGGVCRGGRVVFPQQRPPALSRNNAKGRHSLLFVVTTHRAPPFATTPPTHHHNHPTPSLTLPHPTPTSAQTPASNEGLCFKSIVTNHPATGTFVARCAGSWGGGGLVGVCGGSKRLEE